MRKNTFQKIAVALTGIALSFTACTTDVYEPKTGPTPNEEGVSQELKDFGFATRKSVNLSVNYDAPGFKTLVEIFKENPVDEAGYLKEGMEPVYSAFTDGNGKLDAKMYIPTSVEEAYLYTFTIGLPTCVKLEATADGFTYDATTVQSKTQTKALGDYPFVDESQFPYKANAYTHDGKRTDNLYSLVKWNANGVPSGERVSGLDGNLKIGAKSEQVGVVSSRVTKFLVDNNESTSVVGNKKLLRNPNQINIKAPADGVEVSVTYAGAKGEFDNSFGYYYYKNENPIVAGNFYATKKYIIFPHTKNNNLIKPGATVKLAYFDEQGNAQDKFPAGYTVGWFLISDGFNANAMSYLKQIDNTWLSNYGNTQLASMLRNVCFSNEEGNWRQFITVYDETSKMYVVGIEDQVKGGQDDYMDLTFYVTTSPDLGKGDLEEIPGEGTDDPAAKESISGTLAFEDNWPTGGDYDMNDVALEYSRDIVFNKDNNVTTLEEHFKFIHKDGAASFDNYFAYQVKNVGTIIEKPADCEFESTTNSFIITTSAKTTSGKEFTIKRSFDGAVNKDIVSKDFNPFIIVGKLSDNRTEVHLPMMEATSKANQKQIGSVDDAYYMNVEGTYPFAIDIAKAGFELSRESRSIDKTYPRFATWAESKGKTDADWYNDAPKK